MFKSDQWNALTGVIISTLGGLLSLALVNISLSSTIQIQLPILISSIVFIIGIAITLVWKIKSLEDKLRPFANIGAVGLWRNVNIFKESKGISYEEYCRNLVAESEEGDTIKMIGYDWVELLPETPVLSPYIFNNKIPGLSFEVILLDPQSPAVIEKRMQEMTWKNAAGDNFYPEGIGKNSKYLLRDKILNCRAVAKIFEDKKPEKFKLKETPIPPNVSVLMNSKRAIGVFYTNCHKGKESIIFEVTRKEASYDTSNLDSTTYGIDFYGFLKGYFESVWIDPSWRVLDVGLKPAEILNGALKKEEKI